MATLTLRLVPLLVVLAVLAVWVPELRRARTPAVTAICRALAVLACALLIQLAYPVLDDLTPLPALPHFLMHASGLIAAFWLAAFALHLGQPEQLAPIKIRHRAWLLAAALTALTAFYAVGPATAGLSRISAETGQHPFVPHYIAVFTTYLGLALIDICWICATARGSNHRWLRRGLILLGVGAALGLVYAALRVGTTVLAAADYQLPFSNAGPAGVGTYLMLAGIVFMMIGIALPRLGAAWDTRTTGRHRVSIDTPPATDRHSARHAVARLITEVLAPWVLVLTLPLAIAWHATERAGPTLLWGLVVGVTGSVLPMIVIVRGARRGDWHSHHVTNRDGRVVPFIACISSVAAGITILLIANAPHQMLALALSMFASLLVCSAITFGLKHKISMHAAVAAGAAVTLGVAYGPWLALLLVLAAVIAWSRVELGDHSAAEVSTGLLVGCVTGGALYWALENLLRA